MNALHSKATLWVGSGIFDGLTAFADFEGRVNKIVEEIDRGDIFEIFVEGYLATQAITQCVKHWVVGDIPLSFRERYNLPNDPTGIDGIYETHGGSHVAYQVKYRQKPNLTFAEVAPFLGITEAFTDRVIFTNASTLSDKAIVRTRWVSGEAFNALSACSLKLIEAWLKEQPAPIVRWTPDPNYQVQALQDIEATLRTHDRATVVMACGTGKTIVSLWAAEQANPKTVLVLVPSLTLLQQTLREWSDQTSWESRFSYLCVCSDETVGLKDDELNIDPNEVGFPIDTDPRLVREFLQRDTEDIKVIFSTYHSSKVVGVGARDLPPFDLAIFDEAHKTTGLAGGIFSYALSDENIRISKRLFLTATPRHIDIRHRDKDGDFRVQSMDDESVYGPRAHKLSFASAAKKSIICKYKVIISLINKHMVDDFTRKNGITIIDGDVIGARWVANLIAMQRAVDEVSAKKIISFHSRVKLAQEFAKKEPRGIAYHLHDHDVRHVNGDQSSAARGEIIRAFAEAPQALLTNARCLTEGVNIPAVDMVAFIDPKQSRVDIAQAVGRAMRKPRGTTTKTVGYVLVPVFWGVDDEESLEDAIASATFDAVADVLNALQEHDEELVDIIREIKERKGAGEHFNPKRLGEKIEFIGPRVELDHLTESIEIAIADRLGSSWDEWYGLLLKFREREGYCRVPQTHSEAGYKLGRWVHFQRKAKDRMSPDRRQRLDKIKFEWDSQSAQWEEGFDALLKFKEREGHSLVPTTHSFAGYKLGPWVSTQRKAKDKMSPDRRQRLDDIGFEWEWFSAQWEEGFDALLKFKEREGHCLVPKTHSEAGYKLGQWVDNQRLVRDTMPSDRRQRLDEIGFEWEDSRPAEWEAGLDALLKFKEREGHCLVPKTHCEVGYKLGDWVSNQRKEKDKMIPERRQRLDEIRFEWAPLSARWEAGLDALLKFKEREGHCLVPKTHCEAGYKLGSWVLHQRSRKDRLPSDRTQRLDEIGFVWRVT